MTHCLPRRSQPSASRRLARALALAGLALAAVLAVGACKERPTPTPAPPEPAPAATEEPPVGGRPPLPARTGGLASLAVFPSVSAPLEVANTQPADGAEGVAVRVDEARIVVQFNHPVVPLAAVEDQGDLPVPARIEPAVEGRGEWLNTSTWQLVPSEALAPSQAYEVTVAGGLQSVLGSRLAEDVRFAFTTAGPTILGTHPSAGTGRLTPTDPISVTFNQPMDHRSTERAFALVAAEDGARVRGSFRWDGDEMAFLPREPLARDARYEATLGAGAEAATGSAELEKERTWSFTTAPRPAVERTTPRDGAAEADIQGGLVVRFNTPMRTDGVTVTLQPTITEQGQWWNENDRELVVTGGWLASQAYTATVAATSASRAGDELAEDVVVRFSIGPMAPMASLRTTGSFSLYSAARPPLLYVDARNRERLDLALYSLSAEVFLEATLGDGRWNALDRHHPPEDERLRAWNLDVRAPLDALRRISTTLSAAPDGMLAPGFYLLASPNVDPDDRVERAVVVARDHLALKHAPGEVLVWATDLETGRPTPGLDIAIHEEPDGPPLAAGRTDADGVFRAPIERARGAWEPLVALARDGGTIVGAVSSEWRDGIDTYAFDIGYDPEPRALYGNVYTDRPIYRAGQTAYFRGALRADDDAAYRLADASAVRVEVRDPSGELVLDVERPVGPYGTFEGRVDLSAAARLGDYAVQASVAPAPGADVQGDDWDGDGAPDPIHVASTSFRVAAYRKPEFTVEVSADRERYRQGETIRAEAAAAYYFGGAVAGADATWRVIKDDYFFRPDVDGWWDFVDYDLLEDRLYDAQGEVATSGEGTTDAAGKLAFEVPADVEEYPLAQVLTLDVEATDLNRQVVAGRTSVVVHKADVYLGLRPTAYVAAAGRPLDFEILALDPDGEPVAGQVVDLALSKRTWYSVRERLEDGEYYWTSHFTDTLVAEATATSGGDGLTTASFTPREAGTHRLVATTRDAGGNEARSATYAWVTGGEYVNWRQENNDRIDLVADKKAYRVGDVARILVPAPFEDAEALLTVERGRIRQVRRLTLPTNGETIEIPITPDLAPNAYVSVLLVKGVGPDSPLPQLKLGYTNLAVSIDAHRLSLSVTPDRDGTYGPRETVAYLVRATDATGEPVRAELSAALVDEALLALADDPSTPLEEAFYGQRMLGVATAAMMTQSAERLNRELEAERKGGGGGPASGDGTVRRLFRDTAYWNPSLETDEAGEARFEVELPDNLTTWRLDLRGISGADTRVGAAEHRIVTTKPVLIRPVTPRFLVAGDALQLEAVVNSSLGEDLEVRIGLTGTGLELPPETDRTVTVPAGGKARVVWPVTVPVDGFGPPAMPDALGEAVVRMSAGGGGLSDAVELRLPVYPFSAPQVVATAGQVAGEGGGEAVEVIRLPAEVDASRGALRVALSPSLAAATARSLEWLEAFPYDCTEQTTSKFLPNVATYLALSELDLDDAVREGLRADLERTIPIHLQRLYGLQNGDGGWGWWYAEQSRPLLTAYALLGLTLAERAGFAVSEAATQGATSYLVARLGTPVDGRSATDLNQRAFIAWVLAERDAVPVSRAVALHERRDAMDLYGRAFLALALDRAGGPEQRARIDGLIADIGGRATVSATGARWDERAADRRGMNTNTRTTAIVVLALSRLDPGNPNLAPGVRWLMSEGQDGHWETTQETAWSVLGLTAFMQATGELAGDYDYAVALDGAELGRGSVSAANLTETVTMTVPVADMAAAADHRLAIRRDGDGALYYTTHLRLYRPVDTLDPVDRGIVLGRRYFAVDRRTFEAVGEPIDAARIGDVVQVRLTLVADRALDYLVLEDPIPAGFEIVDTSLKTTSAAARGPQLEEAGEDDPGNLPWWQRGWWSYWAESQLKDDRAVLFASELPRGTYEYTYLIRAGLAGNFHVAPAHAEEMYFPEVFGNSAGGVFTVEE